jgi:hypothetical protein
MDNDSQRTPPATTLPGVDRFNQDHADAVLYGTDDTTGIVAVEMNGPDRVWIYRRLQNGDTERE